jgi:flagellar biosynthetic protein FlhB
LSEQSSEEKTHDPSQKKVDQFRREGRVCQSKDVGSAAQLLMALVAFTLLGQKLIDAVMANTRWTIEQVGVNTMEAMPSLETVLGQTIYTIAPPMLGIAVMMGIAGVGAGLAQTQFLWAPEAMIPKPEKMNPFSRLGQVFHPKKLGMNMALATIKLLAAGTVIVLLLRGDMMTFTSLATAPLATTELIVRDRMWDMLVATTLVLIVLAVADYLWQRSQHNEQIKMTRDEFRRDLEEQEGKPLFKARRRQVHRDLTLNRILTEVPNADVIITNPTHFAVALRYRPGQDKAPIVVAKGMDNMALHIRTIARRHQVAIVENRAIARALFRRVKVGRSVPSAMFHQVARILAEVFRRRNARAGQRPGA